MIVFHSGYWSLPAFLKRKKQMSLEFLLKDVSCRKISVVKGANNEKTKQKAKTNEKSLFIYDVGIDD